MRLYLNINIFIITVIAQTVVAVVAVHGCTSKIDGANLGIRVYQQEILIQNRSHFISSGDHAQFSMLTSFIEEHRHALFALLSSEKLILYGEWCFAQHSLPYNRMPGSYFIAFDLYDIEHQRFYSRARFHTVMKETGLPVVPTIGVLPSYFFAAGGSWQRQQPTSKHPKKKQNRQFNIKQRHQKSDWKETLFQILNTPSRFGSTTIEGMVLRQDSGDWLHRRFKLVRADFVAGCTSGHWKSHHISKQGIDYTFGATEAYLKECYPFADEYIPVLKAPAPAALHVPATRNHAAIDLQQSNSPRQSRIPHCIILMGRCGSGKSTFAQTVASATPTLIANQDSLGRQECVRIASQTRCRRQGKSTCVIIDRCNPTVADRAEWLSVMHNPPRAETALLYFAVDADSCLNRMRLRLGHETIGNGKGNPERILRQLDATLEPPTENERRNIFGRVETIRTWEDARRLLQEWGCLDDSAGEIAN